MKASLNRWGRNIAGANRERVIDFLDGRSLGAGHKHGTLLFRPYLERGPRKTRYKRQAVTAIAKVSIPWQDLKAARTSKHSAVISVQGFKAVDRRSTLQTGYWSTDPEAFLHFCPVNILQSPLLIRRLQRLPLCSCADSTAQKSDKF